MSRLVVFLADLAKLIAPARRLQVLADDPDNRVKEFEDIEIVTLRKVPQASGTGQIRHLPRAWCAESTGFPHEVCEHALAHSLPDKMEATYRRGDLLDKRILLIQSWADYCARPTTAAKVTPICGKSTRKAKAA